MSRFKQFLKYCTTENGREATFYLVFAATTGTVAFNYLPQTFCIDAFREFQTFYKNGMELTVPERVVKNYERALDMLKIDDLDRSRMKLFTVIGFDTYSAGSRFTRMGSIIGVPVNYSYQSPGDIPKSEIVLSNEKRINWDSKDGQMYENALVLTDDEQVFGICRAILHTRTLEEPLRWIYAPFAIFGGYTLARTINTKYRLFERPLGMRMCMYAFVGIFTLGNYFFAKDFTHVRYETKVDKQLAELGEDMVKAGVSYFDKTLNRNVAMRNLSGDNSAFSASGNINDFLRTRSMPFTHRKSFFMEKLKQLQGAAESSFN